MLPANKIIPGFKRAVIFFLLLVSMVGMTSAQSLKDVEKLVTKLSKGKLRVESRATPYMLAGDFNRDGVKDAAIVVELKDSYKKIGYPIKVRNPYAPSWGKEVDESLLQLLIIHGKGKGWRFAQKENILLVGRNSVGVFQKERLGAEPNLKNEGDFFTIERSKKWRIQLVFFTEASEGILWWNGKNYQWTETEP